MKLYAFVTTPYMINSPRKTHIIDEDGNVLFGTKDSFNIIIDVENVNAENFKKAVRDAANLSPFRNKTQIIIEEVVKLS